MDSIHKADITKDGLREVFGLIGSSKDYLDELRGALCGLELLNTY